MTPVGYKKVVVAWTEEDELLSAFFNGTPTKGAAPSECVGMFTCSEATARAHVRALQSALKRLKASKT